MSKSLFHTFEAVSSKAWKQKIQMDLKGADYNDTLIWKTKEDINVKPFYHADEFSTLPPISKSKATRWKIGQVITVKAAEAANTKALEAITRGANHILFHMTSSEVAIQDLLFDIDFNTVSVTISCESLDAETLIKQCPKSPNVNVRTDIIGHLAKTGNWYQNLKKDQQQFESLVKTFGQLNIDLETYQNAGATMVQQLAYGLAHANEYLNHLDTALNAEEKQKLDVRFHVAVGSNYFFEMAKIRALRQLWESLAKAYDVNTNCTITAIPSLRNKTIYDYNVNMLRTTTECMSAVLGGADVVYNTAYDALFHHSNEFGERIARNQLLILKNESYLDKVNNPADGAYYIERLTTQLAENALGIFKTLEANGGFLKQLKEGTIQRKIKESAAKEQADFNAENLVLLGTNKHPNWDDKMKDNLEKQPFLKVEKRKTLIEPVIQKRLAEALEINRLHKE
ncbi:MAG: methylmalonyl-CoA mutase subunit beta [Winogradskyella arenosi]